MLSPIEELSKPRPVTKFNQQDSKKSEKKKPEKTVKIKSQVSVPTLVNYTKKQTPVSFIDLTESTNSIKKSQTLRR